MRERRNQDSKPISFVKLRTVLLFSAAFCIASVLPFLHVHSSGFQVTTANTQSATQPNDSAATQFSDGPPPSFEVASIKKHAADSEGGRGMRVMMGGPDVSQFRASNVTAKMLIATAYNVKEFQISGGPGWISSERWDLNAKVEDSLAEQLQKLTRQQQQAQQALMIRALLADRFKLQITRSTKEGTLLALVVAKDGPKLKEVPPPDPHAGPMPSPPPERGGAPPTPPPGGSMMMMNGNTGVATLSSNAIPISNLVNMLSMQVGQQVVDRTGLKGTYQFTLQFAPQMGLGGMPPPPGAEASSNSDEPSIFTALQEQLGLKLESTKGQIDTITIDHIEEPSEN